MKATLIFVIGHLALVGALRIPAALRPCAGAAVCSGFLLSPLPAHAVSLPDVITAYSEAAYPVLKALPSDGTEKFFGKAADIVLSIKPDKLGKGIDLTLDVMNSVPGEKVAAFSSALKESYGGAKVGSCALAPLPPPSALAKLKSSEALAAVDASKLSAFASKWGGVLRSLPKTDSAICLPPTPASLANLALAQSEVALSFGSAETKAWGNFAQALPSTIPGGFGTLLPLVNEGNALQRGASMQERQALKSATATLESSAKACVGRPEKCGFAARP